MTEQPNKLPLARRRHPPPSGVPPPGPERTRPQLPNFLLDRSDLRALAVYGVALVLVTVAVLWALGLALLVRWLWTV